MKLIEITESPPLLGLISYIQENCSEFLSQSSDPLWRGMTITSSNVLYKQHAARTPVDTPNVIHAAINDFFTLKFGIPFRNGVFATGDVYEADSYLRRSEGRQRELAMVFPVNGFSFCWSPVVSDFYHIPTTELVKKITSDPNYVTETFEKLKYQTTDLQRGIDINHEIMLDCPNGYIAISESILTHLGIDNIRVRNLFNKIKDSTNEII